MHTQSSHHTRCCCSFPHPHPTPTPAGQADAAGAAGAGGFGAGAGGHEGLGSRAQVEDDGLVQAAGAACYAWACARLPAGPSLQRQLLGWRRVGMQVSAAGVGLLGSSRSKCMARDEGAVSYSVCWAAVWRVVKRDRPVVTSQVPRGASMYPSAVLSGPRLCQYGSGTDVNQPSQCITFHFGQLRLQSW